MARVVLNPRATAHLPHHFDVIGGAHPKALGLQEFALPFKFGQPLLQLDFDSGNRPIHPFGTGNIVGCRKYVNLLVLGEDLTRNRVQRHQSFYFVAEHLNSHRVLLIDWINLNGVTAHPEGAALECDVIAGVLNINKRPQQFVAIHGLADTKSDHSINVLLRCPEPIDSRYRCHNQHITTGQQAIGCRMSKSLNLVVDRGVFLDISITLG